MMFKKSLLVISMIAITLVLIGCSAKVIELKEKYDPVLTKALNDKEGNNSIYGNAFLRQVGGGLVTCAGSNVYLFPKTPFSSEIIQVYFPDAQQGYAYGFTSIHPVSNFEKKTMCNSQGVFEFDKIGDGEYFITTNVNWVVPSQYGSTQEGGVLMQYIKLTNNETKKVILSQ